MISSKIEQRITNPKLVKSCDVKTVVCVMNPGPIAEVAIKKAAPTRAEEIPLRSSDFNMILFKNGVYSFCKFKRVLSIAMNADGFGFHRNFFSTG